MAVHNICASSVQNLCHTTILAPRILRWLLDFLKICSPLLLHICEQIPCEENFQFLTGHAYCILSNTASMGVEGSITEPCIASRVAA